MIIKYENVKNIDNIDEIDNKNFSSISPIYSFTTESISGYYNKFDFTEKNVLTLIGSGDHIINAILCGAKNIQAFDINTISMYYSELKLIAIQELTYDEFLRFFMINNIDNINKNYSAMDYKIYSKFRLLLTEYARKFWDNIYIQFKYNGANVRNSILFNNKYDNNIIKINSNIYLSSNEIYNKVKRLLINKEIVLINEDIKNLSNFIKIANNLQRISKYDIIILSNISDYAKNMYDLESNYLTEYILNCILPLKKYINNNGKIIFAYLYNIANTNYRSEIDNPNIRDTVFKELSISCMEIQFDSVIENCYDKILVL